MNSIYLNIGASNHTEKEREINDFYATDPIAIDKLFEVEDFNDKIWECACGQGHLSEKMKEYGKTVFSTDIVSRNGYEDEIFDFLCATDKSGFYPATYDIITNPPYKYAKEFVLKALEILPTGCKCAFFLKLTFLEGKSRYKDIFQKYPPKTVYVFSERVLCAKNAEFEYMKEHGGSAVAFAWFVWEKGFEGETKIKWI